MGHSPEMSSDQFYSYKKQLICMTDRSIGFFNEQNISCKWINIDT